MKNVVNLLISSRKTWRDLTCVRGGEAGAVEDGERVQGPGGLRRLGGVLQAHGTGQAKVRQLRHAVHVHPAGDQDVLGLQIPKDDLLKETTR